MNHTCAYFIDYLKSIENTAKKLRKSFELAPTQVAIVGVQIENDLRFIDEQLEIIWYHNNSCRCEEVDEVDR